MAFKRSAVRSRLSPPPKSLENKPFSGLFFLRSSAQKGQGQDVGKGRGADISSSAQEDGVLPHDRNLFVSYFLQNGFFNS